MRLTFIHDFCKAKEYSGQEVLYIHPKYDGHRITALRQPLDCDNQIVFYTRSQSDLFPEMKSKAIQYNIWPWIDDLLGVPPKTSVDGELYVPGKPASYVKTAIKICDPQLKFVAFALPWFQGQRRYTDSLEWAMDQCTFFRIPFIPFIKLDTVKSVDPNEWIRKASPLTEGWVFKRYHYVKWYKVKRKRTLDLVVMGIVPGKGKYEGLIGSLKCGAFNQYGELKEVCVCSGMTDEERKQFSEKDLGRTCEVQYQEVASLGRLRHPIFLRWRDDEKQPFECTMAQEPELLKYWNKT